MTAGEALDRDNVAGFNCSYLPIDHPKAFDEMMYVLMCGTGVGFSVERQYVQKLPEVAEEFHETDTVINVADSKIGWAKSFRELVSLLYSGQVPRWDVSRVRPSGAPLRAFGGRASWSRAFARTVQIHSGPLSGSVLDENLAPLNVTIFAVRLLKSSSLEESDDQHSSASVTSQTIDSEGANTGSGTLTNPSED